MVKVARALVALALAVAPEPAPRDAVAGEPRRIMAHYMPWFEAKPVARTWGWHWTMNAFDPDRVVDGRRRIASHFTPRIGPYDSSDEDVLEHHLSLMKVAGIDGVIIDWYGRADLHDYRMIHERSARLVELVRRSGMTFAVCYEDRTIPRLIEAGRLTAERRVEHALGDLGWLADNWFGLDQYARVDGRPALLSFGQTGLTDEEWSLCLARLKTPVSYFSQHRRRAAATGAFDWPIPSEGTPAIDRFLEGARAWPRAIPVAFPRFVDIYAQAGVHESYGRIDDRDGATFRETLERACRSNAVMIQIATWNDWGEGTQIEPGREFGDRDLRVVQEMRRKHLDPEFRYAAGDLELPVRLLALRRGSRAAETRAALDRIRGLIAQGKTREAEAALNAQESAIRP